MKWLALTSLALVVVSTAPAATASEFNSSRTDCDMTWCTSRGAGKGEFDCWAGKKNEACTCAQGTATMTGDYKPTKKGDETLYKYTCCKSDPTDGPKCGDYDNDDCPPGEMRKRDNSGRDECVTAEQNLWEGHFAVICIVVIFGGLGLIRFCDKKGWCGKNQDITPNESTGKSIDEKGLQMATPEPLSQIAETIDLQQETVKICLDAGVWPKEKAKRTWGSPLLSPLQMRGVGPQEWTIIVSKLQEVYEANPFVSSCGEDNASCAECCYFCIPGGPIQCVLCLFNPITWCLYRSQDKKKKEAIQTVKPILEQRSVDLKMIEDKELKLWVIFECHQGKFQPPMQQLQTEVQQPQQHVFVR